MSTESIALRQRTQDHATLRDYVSLAKVGITVANLMATFAGFWVSSHGHPNLLLLLFALLGTALVVAGGATLNNYVDMDIDVQMQRTQERALVAGKVKPKIAFWMGITLSAVGLLILTFLVNWQSAACAFVGLVMYAYIYTVWLKRTTTLSTVFGGISGAMPPLIGWTAGNGGVLDLGGWVLFFIFFLWQPPHFLPLAMKKVDDYRRAGIPMLPVVRGFTESKRQIVRYTAAMVPVSLMLYALRYEGLFYFIVMVLLGIGFLVQAVRGFSAKDDLQWANKLFGFSLIYLTGLCIVMVVGVV